MSYDKPTIEMEGGIKAHIQNLGISWGLFVRLDDKKYPNTVIGRELAEDIGREKPFDGRTIGDWRKRRKNESVIKS